MLLLALLGSSGAQTIDTSLDQPIIRRLPPWRPPVVDIKYFGGPVASDPIKLYLIWYGTWDARMKPVVRTMINSFTPSKPIAEYPNLANWWKIVEQYKQKDGKPTSSSVSIGAEVDDVDCSSGKNFSGPSLESFAANELHAIVQHAITNSSLPVDVSNGAMYVVLFAEDVYIRHELIYCGNHHDLLPPPPTDQVQSEHEPDLRALAEREEQLLPLLQHLQLPRRPPAERRRVARRRPGHYVDGACARGRRGRHQSAHFYQHRVDREQVQQLRERGPVRARVRGRRLPVLRQPGHLWGGVAGGLLQERPLHDAAVAGHGVRRRV